RHPNTSRTTTHPLPSRVHLPFHPPIRGQRQPRPHHLGTDSRHANKNIQLAGHFSVSFPRKRGPVSQSTGAALDPQPSYDQDQPSEHFAQPPPTSETRKPTSSFGYQTNDPLPYFWFHRGPQSHRSSARLR